MKENIYEFTKSTLFYPATGGEKFHSRIETPCSVELLPSQILPHFNHGFPVKNWSPSGGIFTVFSLNGSGADLYCTGQSNSLMNVKIIQIRYKLM